MDPIDENSVKPNSCENNLNELKPSDNILLKNEILGACGGVESDEDFEEAYEFAVEDAQELNISENLPLVNNAQSGLQKLLYKQKM